LPPRFALSNHPVVIQITISILATFIAALTIHATAQAQALRVPAGTYAIAEAKDLEARTLYHFLYLHPSGRFLMAAEWPDHETSRAAGRWVATTTPSGPLVTLTGTAHVATNQGTWDTDFRRTFRVEEISGSAAGAATGVRLAPQLEKNHFGMLGWPNSYVFKSAQPTPTLPGASIPADEAKLVALIDTLIAHRPAPVH
jgi:hypothetical protein